MVAGIAVGLSRGWQLDKAVRLGIAAGAAMLLTPGTAPCTREDVERFFEMVADPIDIDAPRRNDGKPRPATGDQPLSAQARTSP
jgi:6-phosphofructokinase 2